MKKRTPLAALAMRYQTWRRLGKKNNRDAIILFWIFVALVEGAIIAACL